MLQKFGKKVMNNFGLKILAVLFAVVFMDRSREY